MPSEGTQHRHLGAIFFERVAELGDRRFVKVQRGERFDEISWREFGAKVRAAMFALYDLGLNKGDRVAIIGENCLEWLCADLATLGGGLPNVIASPALSDGMLLKIVGHSACRAAFVHNHATAARLFMLKAQLPALDHVIVFEEGGSRITEALSFDEFLARGADDDDQRLRTILASVRPEDFATIIYTSGSTGVPKGVMRTQNNLLANISNGGAISLSSPDELTVIVLSLNHLFGRFGFLKSVATGRATAIVESIEKTADVNVIGSLAPTALALVPRVVESILDKIFFAHGCAEKYQLLCELDRRRESGIALAAAEEAQLETLSGALGAIVRKALGGRIKYIAYGGAAMPPRILRFFRLIGMPLLGSYGVTECGGVTLSGIGDPKPASLGRPFSNVELRIAEDGEVLVRGPTVSPGYFNDPEATREAIDAQGWFHTGDFGKIDDDGCLFIVGRKKDVFNCADGSNIYPARIELLLESDRFIRQAILVGDQRPFIAAVIVPDRAQIAAELRKPESSLNESEIEALIWPRIETINGSLEEYERIRKLVVLSADFSPAVRSVTTFQKIKVDRRAFEENYRATIDAIYAPQTGNGARLS